MASQQGFPEQAPPSEEEIAATPAAGGQQMPTPGTPVERLGEPGQEASRAEQFKAGVAPQTPGVCLQSLGSR